MSHILLKCLKIHLYVFQPFHLSCHLQNAYHMFKRPNLPGKNNFSIENEDCEEKKKNKAKATSVTVAADELLL